MKHAAREAGHEDGAVGRRMTAWTGMAAVVLWGGLAWGDVTNPDAVAVIIGNSRYDHADPVEFAYRDADAFRDYVVDLLGFDPERVIKLQDAGLTEMYRVFGRQDNHRAQLWRMLKPNRRSDVVVFYSGHGVPGLDDKRGYLMPSDAEPDFAAVTGYSLDLLHRNLGQLETRSVAVYVDACFSGDSEVGMLFRDASPVGVPVRLPDEGDGRVTLLTAASGKQLASWDREAKHGLFTKHLLDGLYGRADRNQDGRVTAGEAKQYLDDHMTPVARKRGREQTATLRGRKESELSVARFPARSLREAKSRGAELEKLRKKMSALEQERTGLVQALETKQGELGQVRMEKDAVERQRQQLARELKDVNRKMQSLRQERERLTGKVADQQRELERLRLVQKQTKPERASAEATERGLGLKRPERERKPGRRFRDCAGCPEMVVVPAGSFMMGSPESEAGRWDNEGPVHRVRIERPFAVGVYEVTRGEYSRFVSATGHVSGDSCRIWNGEEWENRSGSSWRSPGFGQTDAHPVVCVSWEDARSYVGWLSERTGEEYRLLSESEWEYVARGGTETARYWGESELGQCRYANGADGGAEFRRKVGCSDGYTRTSPVGSYRANGWGLHDVLGNVWEWVEDCWNRNYEGAPEDGSAWLGGDCGRRVLRGGSWDDGPWFLRSAFRIWDSIGSRSGIVGFRVARTLTP